MYPNWQGIPTINSSNTPILVLSNLIVSSIQTNGISTNTIKAKNIYGYNNYLDYIQNTNILTNLVTLDGQGLTASPAGLYLNGNLIAASVSTNVSSIGNWSQFKAVSDILASSSTIKDVKAISTLAVSTGYIKADYILANDIKTYNTINAGSLTTPTGYINNLTGTSLGMNTAVIATKLFCPHISTININATSNVDTDTLTAQTGNINTINSSYITAYQAYTNNIVNSNKIFTNNISSGLGFVGVLSTNALYTTLLGVDTININYTNTNYLTVSNNAIFNQSITVAGSANFNNTTNTNGALNLNNQVNLNATMYGQTTQSIIYGQKYLQDINNIRNGKFESISVVGGWTGDDFLPPYHNASYLTVGNTLGFTQQGIVTINGELPDPLNPGQNITTALTVRGDADFDLGLVTTYNGLKCLPFNLTANALEVIGITYLNGIATVTGILNGLGNINCAGVFTATGIANLNGGVAIAGGFLQLVGSVRFGEEATAGSYNLTSWHNTYLNSGLSVNNGMFQVNSPSAKFTTPMTLMEDVTAKIINASNINVSSINVSSITIRDANFNTLIANQLTVSTLTASNFTFSNTNATFSTIHTNLLYASTSYLSTIYTNVIDVNPYNSYPVANTLYVKPDINLTGNLHMENKVLYCGAIATDGCYVNGDLYTHQLFGNPYGTSIGMGSDIVFNGASIYKVRLIEASTISCSNISTSFIYTNVMSTLQIAASTIITNSITPFPSISQSIDINGSVYLYGNLHAENQIGYFGITTMQEASAQNINVSTLTGRDAFGGGVDIKVLAGLDMRGNNLSNLSTVSGYNGGTIDFVNELNMNLNDVSYVNTLHCSNIQNDSGSRIQIRNNLDMNNNDIQNGGQINGGTVNAGSVNCDNIQPLTGSDINGNSGNLVNFNAVKATTLFGDYIQAYSGSGITFNNSVDMGSGNITNVVDVAATEIHLTDAIYTNSIQSLNTGTVEFRTNNVSNINNLYVTTGIDTNLVYTNYLASSNGTIYLQTGTNLDGSTFQSLSNFAVVQAASGSFNACSVNTLNANSAPYIMITSDTNMSNNTIYNINGLSSMYLSTNVIKANQISTNSLIVSSVNNKPYPYTSTLNIFGAAKVSSYTIDGITSVVPKILISNIRFPQLGNYYVSEKNTITKSAGGAGAEPFGSICLCRGLYPSTFATQDGFNSIPFINATGISTFNTYTTSISITDLTQMTRNLVYYDQSGHNYTLNMAMADLRIRYTPAIGNIVDGGIS